MEPISILIACFTLASAIASLTLRNLVHCTLSAALAFAGLAGIFLNLGAEFVGLAQVLVYVGAVAVLIVFAILLTRGSEPSNRPIFISSWWVGLAVAALVGVSLIAAVQSTTSTARPRPAGPTEAAPIGVTEIGTELMTRYVLPLEITALLLTVAAIGAVLIAMRDTPPKS